MNKKAICIISAFAVAVLAIVLAVLLWPKANAAKVVGICYRQGSKKTAYQEQLERSLAQQGYTLITVDADEDQNKQLVQIKQLADQGCKLLLVEPVMSDSVPQLLQTVQNTKLPVILINRQLNADTLQGYSRAYYIGNRDEDIVQRQVEMMQAMPNGGDLNGDGTVACLILSGPKEYIRSERYESDFRSRNDLQILSLENGQISQEDGRKLCRQKLSEYGKDIEVIFCIHDRMAAGAAEAVENGGRTVGKDVYLFGVGGEEISMVETGEMSGTAFVDQNAQIRTICDTAEAIFAGKTVSGIQLLPYIISKAER